MTPITYLCKQTADFKKCSIEPKYYNELTYNPTNYRFDPIFPNKMIW